ncbi:MAG TPA: rnhA operon protein [Halococcus sp.]|nr:rnhA operon protein [Halococcus sp.]
MTELSSRTIDEAERLTRQARAAVDENERKAYREKRTALLAEYGFSARVREDATAARGRADREDDSGEVLVCYPSEWVEAGEIRTERIEDTERAVERRLTGTEDPDDWEVVAAHNERVTERVGDAHGVVHGTNARAFADFMSNHAARRVESATEREIEEFLGEYFVRNAWPTDEQKAVIEKSLSLVFDAAEAMDETSE